MADNDLILNGSGTVTGGSFQRVSINGSGTITSDVECQVFECNGSGRVKGDVMAQSCSIAGGAKIEGDIHAKEVKVHGSSTIEGKLLFLNLEVRGSTKVKKGLKGESVSVEGSIKVNGDFEAETADFDGSFEINGLLNADRIDIGMHGRCYAQEIGGETIKVKKKSGMLLDKLIKAFNRELHCELIEGDTIQLEYTTAKIVRGTNVYIGPGCEIDLIEYKNDLKIDNSAKVKESKKVE